MTTSVIEMANGRFALKLTPRVLWVACGLICALVAIFAMSLGFGSYDMSVAEAFRVLWNPEDGTQATVVWKLRIPRFIAACFVGAMFAMSGAMLQNVTRNPIADPSLVGVSQGAGLAVVALIVLWPDVPVGARPVAAFAGGMLAALLVQAIAAGKQSTASMRFILVGIGVASMILSLIHI